MLKGVHEKDVAEINQRLAELEAKLNTDIAGLKESVKELTAEVAVLEKEYSSSSVDVRSSIEALEKEQTDLRHDFELREQKHLSDLAAIQAQIDAKTELIRAEHSADIDRLENSQERLQEKIDTAVADLRQELVTLNQCLQRFRCGAEKSDCCHRKQIGFRGFQTFRNRQRYL